MHGIARDLKIQYSLSPVYDGFSEWPINYYLFYKGLRSLEFMNFTARYTNYVGYSRLLL